MESKLAVKELNNEVVTNKEINIPSNFVTNGHRIGNCSDSKAEKLGKKRALNLFN